MRIFPAMTLNAKCRVRRTRRRGGFTLMELTVVLLIAGIAAAAAAIRVQGPMRTASMSDTMDAIGEFDRITRLAAGEHDRSLCMVVNVSVGTLRRVDGATQSVGGTTLKLPDSVRMSALLVRQESVTEGEISVGCSRGGFTPTWAFELQSGPRKQWCVIVGLTGELVKVKDEQAAREIIAATGLRHHAG